MSQGLRIIIVDDEMLARQVLREHLVSQAGVDIVAECANGFEAVKAITEQHPDLVFLDVQMPKLDGFEVLELIGRTVPVIFVTAYDEFAVRAFEVHAVDYLLKPFSGDRIVEALGRAKARIVPPATVAGSVGGAGVSAGSPAGAGAPAQAGYGAAADARAGAGAAAGTGYAAGASASTGVGAMMGDGMMTPAAGAGGVGGAPAPFGVSQAHALAGMPMTPPAAQLRAEARPSSGPLERILIRDGSRVHVIPVNDVDFVQAQDDYVCFHAGGKQYLKEQPLAEVEASLNQARFVRIHRSYLLNVDRLARVEPLTKDSRLAILKDGRKLPLSRAGFQRLNALL